MAFVKKSVKGQGKKPMLAVKKNIGKGQGKKPMLAVKKNAGKGQGKKPMLAVSNRARKGLGKAGTSRGKGKPAGGTWMFVPTRGAPIKASKGSGKARPQSKFLDKLDKIDASQKVWIGGLKPTTTWKALDKHVQEIAGQKPKITEILPKGKACLAFKTDEDAESSITLLNDTELQGNTIQADVWKQREKRPEGEKKDKRARNKKDKKAKTTALKVAKSGFAKRNAKQQADKPRRGDDKIREKLDTVDSELKVWVGGMKKETKFGTLKKFFADAGHKPSLVNLMGKDKACLSFNTAQEASDAITTMNGKELDDANLEVDVWTQVSEEDKAARREANKERTEARKAAKAAEKAAKAA